MNLNSIMEFDHVITVAEDGSVSDAPSGIYAPSLLDDELDDSDWVLLDGWSGQDRHSGPVMHPSESIGGAMAVWILGNPGIYVAIVADYTCAEHEVDCQCDCVAGWAVAQLMR